MQLKFIGKDKSMKLENGKVYDVKIHANYDRIWVHVEETNRILNCPYNSIKLLLEDWEEL